MPFEIVFVREAVNDMKDLSALERTRVQEAMEVHLRHEPTRVSRSRIKRLRGMIRPQYRLRVDELRVYFDVIAADVIVYGVIPKSRQDAWLLLHGLTESEETDDEDDSTGGSSE